MGRKQWFGTVLPLLAWAATTAVMIRQWQNDPYNPALKGTASYGHNGPGALEWGVLYATLDLAVLCLVLRPWSYDRSWRRAAIALLLFTPWALLNVITLMHAGSVWATHIMSAVAIWLGLVVLLAVSGVATFLRWRYTRETGPLPANPRISRQAPGGRPPPMRQTRSRPS
jgi:hypothetical protein